jgi:hypothetical protein
MPHGIAAPAAGPISPFIAAPMPFPMPAHGAMPDAIPGCWAAGGAGCAAAVSATATKATIASPATVVHLLRRLPLLVMQCT